MEVKISRKEWVFYILTSAATVAMVYAITTDNFELRVLRGTSIAFQTTARIIGQWGLYTERVYHTLIENGRMV